MVAFQVPFPRKCVLHRLALAWVVYWLSVLPVLAQSSALRFRHLTRQQGLSSSTIEAIVQDQQGFIWIGTHQGLNRYDGYAMKVYSAKVDDSTSLSDESILCLYVSKSGVLWVGTAQGLNCFKPLTNTFTRYLADPADTSSLSNPSVTCMLEDRRGHFWVGTAGGGLNRLDVNRHSFTRFRSSITPSGMEQITALLEDRQGHFWVGTQQGLALFDPQTGHFSLIHPLTQAAGGLGQDWITALAQDAQGTLWIGTSEDGLYRWQPGSRQMTHFSDIPTEAAHLSAAIVKCLLVDRQDRLWVGTTNGGLNRWDSATGRFVVDQPDPANAASLSQKTVSGLLEDNQGNVWVGTHRGGVNLYCPSANRFGYYTQPPTAGGLSYKDVRTFCQDRQGMIWVGTDGGGLNRYDPQQGTFQAFRHDPANPHSLGSDAVLHVLEDRQGTLWVATWGGGLNRFDRRRGHFTRFLHDPDDASSIGSNNVWRLLEDRQGNLWVGTINGGLNRLDRTTGRFTRLGPDSSSNNHPYGRAIISLHEDAGGKLWMGTIDGGLNGYDPVLNRFMHYFYYGQKTLVQGSNDLRVLFTDHRGRLWVGQRGLYLYDAQQRVFRLYTRQAGLDQERIQALEEDDQGNFWLSTSSGLIRFHPDRHTVERFNQEDGLQDGEFNMNASLRAANGELYFGGINGFNRFHPERIPSLSSVTPVVLTGLQLFNQPIAFEPVTSVNNAGRPLTLSYRQSALTLEFSALPYARAEKTQYAYRLDGFDADWHYVGTEHQATYTNLDPGEYRFRVKATHNPERWPTYRKPVP